MKILKLFSGKDPQLYEQKGDLYFQSKAWGKAKIEYEAALAKLERKSSDDAEFKNRLEKKIRQSKESLALEHKKSADDLVEGGYDEEARELYALALELTENSNLSRLLEKCLQKIEYLPAEQKKIPDFEESEERTIESTGREDENEYFIALCSTLPDGVKKAYLAYGDAFKKGYIALNQGNFEQAAKQLSLAMKENPSPESFIPLELATTYLNLEKYEEARALLEEFVKKNPEVLPGYQLLCEIFWEAKAFDRAANLLYSIPGELKESLAVYLLRGETFFRAHRYTEAKALYLDFLQSYGWHEPIVRALAQTFEVMGETENAHQLYGEIMSHCRNCGSRTDPFIKRKYADLSYALGRYSTKVLELYFSLVSEDPERAAEYHQKISRIYSALGHEAEARRFRLIANKRNGK